MFVTQYQLIRTLQFFLNLLILVDSVGILTVVPDGGCIADIKKKVSTYFKNLMQHYL